MIVADAQEWAAGWIGPFTALLLVGALASAASYRLLPRGFAWVGFVFFLSAAGAVASARFRTPRTIPTQHVAWLCAWLCLFWSLATAAANAGGRKTTDPWAAPRLSFVALGRLAAVLFGVVAAIIQFVVLVMRMIYVGVDIVHGYPWQGVRDYGFSSGGLWSLALLFVSCLMGLTISGVRRLATVQLWIVVLLVFWACLLDPPFRMNSSGAYERTSGTLGLLASLSLVLTGAAGVERWFANQLNAEAAPSTGSRGEIPGFFTSCGVLLIVIMVLTCYHLLVPVRTIWGGFLGSTLSVFVSSAVAVGGSFLLLEGRWGANMADAALGVGSLSLCGLAMLAVPSQPTSLAERYPMMFNAIIVGLTLATGLWTWLADGWSRNPPGGGALSTSARLIPHAKRFAFLNAALALVAGALMTYWPRLRSIAGMDHTLGRITAGFAAHLFLVLVMLWSSRRLRSLTFNLLTVLAVLSTGGFIIVRMRPFASRLG